MRLIDADALMEEITTWQKDLEKEYGWHDAYVQCLDGVISSIESASTVNPWHRVEDELPKEPGEYIVAYHPCYWDDVKTKVTKVGIDNFRGKSAWAKKKFQRVTHWMEKPEPPKEGTHENRDNP